MIYNLNENFIKSVERFQDRVAIGTIDRKKDLTYSQLGKKVKRLGYLMASLGLRKLDRVAVILENRPEWPIIFFALSYIGGVAVPIDTQLPEKDIKNILLDSGARFIFVSKENQRLYKFLKDFEPIEKIIVIGLEEKEDKFIPFRFDEALPPEGFKGADISPDDLMLILYTSGTTDLPKGVMLTHKNLCANFNSLSQLRLFSYKDIVVSVLPLYHSYPLMTTLIMPILSGAKIVYLPPDWPERLVDYLKEAKISIFIGVPQIFHMIHARLMKRLKELSIFIRLYIKIVTSFHLQKILLPTLTNTFGKSLRFFTSGGAKLDENVARDFLKLGFKILEGYGLTETAPVVSFNPLKKLKIGSVGRAVPDVKLKIVNKDTSGIGEIAIKGPNVMKGYYKDDVKTKDVIKNEWFLSGDLGYIDRQEYLYITGRSKELIVLSTGKNIFPEEVESHYSTSPYVKEMCVMGVLKEKGKGKVEYLHAIVVPDLEFFKERGEMNVRGVIKNSFENLSKDLPSYKHIMGFTITKEGLPRTVLGKTKRYEIERKFLPIILKQEQKEPELIDPEEKKLYESSTAKRLIACIRDVREIKTPIHLGDSIELDLGVDSLGRVELLCAVENCFNIDLPDQMIASEIFTVKDLLFKVEDAVRKGRRSTEQAVDQREEKGISWPEILRQSLSDEFQKKISLRPDWIDYILTFLVKGFISLFFRIFYSLKVEGAHRIPKKGPYVLCVNHTSFLDGFIVAASVPFRTGMHLFFIGFRRYFIVPIVRDLVRRARIIPIDATEIIDAMRGSSFILRHNKALCIFPEGERSIDGEVKEFKKGIGIIAKELNIALVPLFIKGAFKAWPRIERFPRLCPIKVRFGDPVAPQVLIQKGMALGARDEYEAISLGIREELCKLKDM